MNSRLRIKTTGKLGFGVKLRFGEKLARDEWFHLDLDHGQEEQAEDRLKRLQRMARLLNDVGAHADARAYLDEAASQRHERGFRAIEERVEKLSPAAAEQAPVMTFRKVVQQFTSGALHELYPDELKPKSSKGLERSAQQLAVFFPALGDKTFDEITRDDIQKAKLLVPKGLATTSRAVYLRELARIMRIAVEPLGLAEKTVGLKVRQASSSTLFTFLYPAEEAALAGCLDVPFELRFLFAFMVRNGTRISETLRIDWDHIDLASGVINIAAEWTKTGVARFWDLAPDVLEALRLRRRQIPDAELVFVPPAGFRSFTRHTIWHRFLPALKTAGLTRRGIFRPDRGENQLRLHDLRASFCTLARALGRPDRWIMDRSGHENASVFEGYDRGARHARERNLGWFNPMPAALKMTAPALGQSRAKAPKMPRKEAVLTFVTETHPSPPPPINPANLGGQPPSLAQEGPFGPCGLSTLGQSSPLSADALSELLDLARAAKRWHLVAPLGEALEQAERVREQASPKVTDIATARRRKEDR